MSIKRKAILALVVAALFFVLLEVALRVVGWPQLPEVEANRFEHNEVFWIDQANQVDRARTHGERLFRMPAQVAPDGRQLPLCEGEQARVDDLQQRYGTTFNVSSDERGVRAPHHPLEKPAESFRILAMGCSTTFGWGVEDDESWPARLEHYLHAAGHTNIEVINGGQPGYSTYQGMRFWEEFGSQYDPDLVVLGFVIQDSRKVAYSDLSQAILQDRGALLKQGLLYQSNLYQGLKLSLGEIVVSPQSCLDDAGNQSEQCVYRVGDEDYLANLRTLRESIEASGAEVMHFAFPEEVAEGHSKQHRRLLGIEADYAGIPFFDPSVEIEREGREGRKLYGWEAPNPTFEVDGDCLRLQPNLRRVDLGHANAAGLDRIAQLFARYMEEQGLTRE